MLDSLRITYEKQVASIQALRFVIRSNQFYSLTALDTRQKLMTYELYPHPDSWAVVRNHP